MSSMAFGWLKIGARQGTHFDKTRRTKTCNFRIKIHGKNIPCNLTTLVNMIKKCGNLDFNRIGGD